MRFRFVRSLGIEERLQAAEDRLLSDGYAVLPQAIGDVFLRENRLFLSEQRIELLQDRRRGRIALGGAGLHHADQ